MYKITAAWPACVVVLCGVACGQTTAPATAPAGGKLAHIQVDVPHRQVRVECQAVRAEYGLEYFLCCAGTEEYESILSTQARPSQIHLALLMVGLQAGTPAKYSPSLQKWLPAQGPPLLTTCEYRKGDQTVSIPAYRLMRSRTSKKEAAAMTWVFAGSRVLEDGTYAADDTGGIISILTSDSAVIQIPELRTTSLEDREFAMNADLVPPMGTTVWLVIEPAGKGNATVALAAGDAGAMAAELPTTEPTDGDRMARNTQRLWEINVGKYEKSLTDAAEMHYKVIEGLENEKRRLTDESDRIGNLIDDLEKRFSSMSVPRPGPGPAGPDAAAPPATAPNASAAGSDQPPVGTAAQAQPHASGHDAISNVSVDEKKVKELDRMWREVVPVLGPDLQKAIKAQNDFIQELRDRQNRLIDQANWVQRLYIDELQKKYGEYTTPPAGGAQP